MIQQRRDEGLTLIETLISMLILSTAVIVIVAGLSNMILAGQYHRGYAVAEAASKNYAQAIQRRANFSTTLDGAITSSQTSVTVADGTGFPTADFLVGVDNEVLRVTMRSGNTLTVVRASGESPTSEFRRDPATQSSHADDSPVVRVFRCPSAAEMLLQPGEYTLPAGASATVTGVTHWLPSAGDFVSTTDCKADYVVHCRFGGTSEDIRANCDRGLHRLEVLITTPGDSRLKAVETTTQVLVRRGGAS